MKKDSPVLQIMFAGGMAYVTRNGEFFRTDSENPGNIYRIEKVIRKAPPADWRLVMFRPKNGGTYQRKNRNEWVLI